MKKTIFIILFIVINSYASGDMVFALLSTFKKDINQYYKLWAVGYCMGHFKIEKNIKFGYQEIPARFNIDDFQINKIVYLLGIEPLNELKAYIDKDKNAMQTNIANHCLYLLLDQNHNIEGHHSLEDEIKRIVKKYCKECK
ncbi:hypothetical protein [Campylobacter troglodytis]|uniref:hypothetical protein n=1 Tax=Campylobacter troglodytis TaxID=654363 RepID=UPI00115A152F|nr:hypothetical protein [Campylobacter troglodytis]TQR61059.1 hypothetical protein DMC01_02695 [Campylobacter troglodytis]